MCVLVLHLPAGACGLVRLRARTTTCLELRLYSYHTVRTLTIAYVSMCLFCRGMRPGEVKGKDYYLPRAVFVPSVCVPAWDMRPGAVEGKDHKLIRLCAHSSNSIRMCVCMCPAGACGLVRLRAKITTLSARSSLRSGSQGGSCWSMRGCTGSTRASHADRWTQHCNEEQTWF